MKMLMISFPKIVKVRDALTLAREALVDTIGESDLTKQLQQHEAFLTAAMVPTGKPLTVKL